MEHVQECFGRKTNLGYQSLNMSFRVSLQMLKAEWKTIVKVEGTTCAAALQIYYTAPTRCDKSDNRFHTLCEMLELKKSMLSVA